MKIAVLFDGAGLARLGLEKAGHDCTGFEIDYWTHRLSKQVGSGNSILMDAREVDLSKYEAVWASPPCQRFSIGNIGATPTQYVDHLDWCVSLIPKLKHLTAYWIENVVQIQSEHNGWGAKYNAAQFTKKPLQSRPRVIGGFYKPPKIYRPYRYYYRHQNICPSIMATEWKRCPTSKRAAARYYNRKLTLEECAYHQGFEIPKSWYKKPLGFTNRDWTIRLYEAIGNGVPVYMSRAFGDAYTNPDNGHNQELIDYILNN